MLKIKCLFVGRCTVDHLPNIRGAGTPKRIVGSRTKPPRPAGPTRAKPGVDPTTQATANTAAKRCCMIAFLLLLRLPSCSLSNHPTGCDFLRIAMIGRVLRSFDAVALITVADAVGTSAFVVGASQILTCSRRATGTIRPPLQWRCPSAYTDDHSRRGQRWPVGRSAISNLHPLDLDGTDPNPDHSRRTVTVPDSS
jgi:hypothetical protein